jgi:hypothetical protein
MSPSGHLRSPCLFSVVPHSYYCLCQILPSVLTCVVASRLGPGNGINSSSATSLDEASISSWGGTHYDIRLYAAKVVSVLVQNYRYNLFLLPPALSLAMPRLVLF